MQSALRITTSVQPGGKIEVVDAQLPPGEQVDVIVLFSQATKSTRPSLLEVLSQAPGHLGFQSAEEVDAYIRSERDAWDD